MLHSYVSDTLGYVDTVTDFCNRKSKWMLQRKTEVDLMEDIQERANELNIGINQVFKSTEKVKAIGKFFRNMQSSDSKRKELEKELATVLENTAEGMEQLTDFLDAVEKLAVTSLHVFTGGEEVVKLSLGISLESVEGIISAARLVCPLLLQFKRDAGVYFHPSLHNVAFFVAELDQYICTTEKICTTMEKCSTTGYSHKRLQQPSVDFAEDLTEEVMQSIRLHVKTLSILRENKNFRLVYLFQEKSMSDFVIQFTKCHPRMLQFLDDMEDCAIQLDRMKMGSDISSIVGSSVGAVGGVLSIVGLALAPFTAGVSLGLTLGGLGLGVTSGVNGVVTAITMTSVNKIQQERATEGLKSFMEDVFSIQECLDKVTNQRKETFRGDCQALVNGAKVVRNIGTIGRGIDALVDGIDDIGTAGTAAIRGPAALSKSVRAGFITVNALFLGFDIFVICKDSISLARGDKSELSRFIRARAALLRSKLDAWQTMHESLNEGMLESERGQRILEQSLNLL